MQRGVAQHQLGILHKQVEEPEVGQEQHRDRRRTGGKIGPAEQPDVEQRMGSPKFEEAEYHAIVTPPATQPETTGSPQPRLGASITPNTNIATALPMSTAPGQSTGGASLSREDDTVSVKQKTRSPTPASAQKTDCHGQ